MFSRTCYIVMLAAVYHCSSLWAVTRYVSHSGSNTPPYTIWETATPRLALASQSAQPGDTIRIAAGVFIEPEMILLNGGITLIGAGADSTELRNNIGIEQQIRAESGNLVVAGIKFTGKSSTVPWPTAIHFFSLGGILKVSQCVFEDYESAISNWGAYLDIRDCQFIDCGTRADVIYIGVGAGNGKVTNCNFTTDPARFTRGISIFMNLYGLGSGGFEISRNLFHGYKIGVKVLWSPSLVTIGNNLFVKNSLPSQSSPPLSAPYLDLTTPYVEVRNNLFEGSYDQPVVGSGSVITCLALWSYQQAEISRNIFVGKQRGIRVDNDNYFYSGLPYYCEISFNDFWLESPAQPIVFNNDVFHQCENYRLETDSSLTLLQSNLCRDPMFLDTIDYLLQAGSPCIDAGRPAILDVDGSRSDIGPFGGPGGVFYVYQDLPPRMPQGLDLSEIQQSIRLSWLGNTESDLSYYILFRDTQSPPALDSQHVLTYVSSNGRLFGTTDQAKKQPLRGGLLPLISSVRLGNRQSLHYIDIVGEVNESIAYALVAVDSLGLISQPALIGQTSHSGKQEQTASPLPEEFALEQNYPNPFNAATAIVYNLPNIGAQPASIQVVIYNSLGQQVRTLVEEPQHPGRHTAYWDGMDSDGKEVASGVYFYKLSVSDIIFVKSKKMILVK